MLAGHWRIGAGSDVTRRLRGGRGEETRGLWVLELARQGWKLCILPVALQLRLVYATVPSLLLLYTPL